MASSPEGFYLPIQSTALYGKFRNTASFCDAYYTISIRKNKITGEKCLQMMPLSH